MPEDQPPQPPATLDRLATLLLHGDVEVVDCSSVLGPATPLEPASGGLPAAPETEIHKISEYDEDGPFFAWNWLVVGEHSGTHFEAPHAWAAGRECRDGATDTLDPDRLAAPAFVIDCSEESAADPDFLLTEERIRGWEAVHGEIGPRSWVLMRTDWDRRAGSKDEFLNGGRYPGPAPDAMRYLVAKGIVGWGTQCVSPDCGRAEALDTPWPARSCLAEAGCFGLASLASLDRLPPTGAIFIAAPLKFTGGNGSPVRALALVPRGNRPV